MEEEFKKEMKILYQNKVVESKLKFQVIDIKRDFNEYSLSLRVGNCEISGFYIKEDDNIKLDFPLSIFKLELISSDFNFKVYITNYYQWIKKDENIMSNKITKYNLDSQNIISFFQKLGLINQNLIKEDVFLIEEISTTVIKLKEIMNRHSIKLDCSNLTDKDKFENNKFLYVKNFSIEDGKIILNNLSFIEKATDYQIFKILDNKINKLNSNSILKEEDFCELKPVDEKSKNELSFIFSKIVLKNKKEKYIIMLDEYHRIIRYKNNIIDNLNLYDLILIIKCTLLKARKDDLIYDLKLKENSIFHICKDLILNKQITINNYTIIDIFFPDFNKSSNYVEKIILCNKEIPIVKMKQRYLFKFINEQFNEIVPFPLGIKCKNQNNIDNFKFFITHGIINKINIFVNYKNKKKCAIDYCYYNIYADVPFEFNIEINSTKYNIKHFNNFDSNSRISFIFLNVPQNELTKKIDDKNDIISAQIWYVPLKDENEENKLKYYSAQILNVNEAMPRVYQKYNLKEKNFEIFNDFYFEFKSILKNYKQDKSKILEYFDKFDSEVVKIEKDIKLLKKYYNIEYDPDSADNYVYKIYASLSLFLILKEIKNRHQNKLNSAILEWNKFLINYSNLLKIINEISNKFTNHQKIRIIDSYTHIYSKDNSVSKRNSCKFWCVNPEMETESSDNSYFLALSFNKNIIYNLKENSALTIGYIQLDSYIMTNYFIKDKYKTYSLSNEPIILMKYHLLLNYENFLFIYFESLPNGTNANSLFYKPNRITFINEGHLFNMSCSEALSGNDFAFPIFIEFFHEKDSHSKKSLKNLRIKSPIVCYKNDYNASIILEEAEDGTFLESLIGDQEFIIELKKFNNKLGELMKIEYFTDIDFHNLHEKFNKIMKLNKSNNLIITELNNENESDSDKTKKGNKLKSKKDLL